MSENASLPKREGGEAPDCKDPASPRDEERRDDRKGPDAPKFSRHFFAALALSVAFGGAGGLILGANTGVRPALEAATRVDAAILAQALPWKLEVASNSSARLDLARLLDEIRGLRAQIEQMRHNAETSRAAERLRALEPPRAPAAEAEPTLNRAAAALTARLGEIELRVSRLERAGADATPVGAIRKGELTDSTISPSRRAGAPAH